MNEHNELVMRASKMSFLLGLATGGLSELIRLDLRPQEQKQPTVSLLGYCLLFRLQSLNEQTKEFAKRFCEDNKDMLKRLADR
jgi:hypothetical protein